MLLLIIAVMCSVFLFPHGIAKEQECTSNNVTTTLLKVINEKCTKMRADFNKLKDENYNCTLEQKATGGRPTGPRGLFSFDGRSTFNGDWKSTLTAAVINADQVDPTTSLLRVTVMCALDVKKIGCNIEPTNPEKDEMLLLRCNYKYIFIHKSNDTLTCYGTLQAN